MHFQGIYYALPWEPNMYLYIYIYIEICIYIYIYTLCISAGKYCVYLPGIYAYICQAVIEAGCKRHNDGNDAKGVQCHTDSTAFPELEDLQKLAGLGNGGKYPNNCKRDLLALLAPFGMPVTEHDIPLKCGRGLKLVGSFAQPFLMPHLMLAAIWSTFSHAWGRLVCEGPDQLEAFWNSMWNHPALVNHPMTARAGWKRRAIPLSVHTDAVPVSGVGRSWSKSMLNISFSCILAKGATRETQFLIFALMTMLQVVKPVKRTMRRVWELIVQSFVTLYEAGQNIFI